MSNGPFIGRRESVGLGKEAVPFVGSVAPTNWQPHLSLTLDPKTTVAQNTSAMGVEEDINDSAVVEQWAEGSLQGKVTDTTFGLPLINLFGTEVYALKETGVGTHTFTKNNTTAAPSLTLARVSPLVSRRYALGYQTDLELSVAQGDWATFTSSLVARIGATAADTAAYAVENEFTSKHVTVKLATNVAGLSGATALDVKSVKLKITRKRDRYTPMGAIDPTSFDPNEWSVTGELVLRYTDTTLEVLGNANTRQAMSISLINTDVTIGATSNPSLVFTAPKTRLSPLTLDNNLNQVLNQTIAFTCELDAALGYMVTAVLTNTKTSAY
jgi:hypothetical protein